MKEIPLSQGLFALVDDEDFEELNKFKWFVQKNKNTFYAKRHIKKEEQDTTIYMHNIIMKTPKEMVTDHINHNGLDNQKSNLRIVTQRQNMHNKQNKTSSMFVGVHWHKLAKKWNANIRVNGKQIYLGQFNNEEEAHNAYLNKLADIGEVFVDNL
jgi:hypothetical protein